MERLKQLAQSYLPPSTARMARRAMSAYRFRQQLSACRAGFEKYGDRYPHSTLFVAGLPKSGTTWMEKMLCNYPGFHEIMIPNAVRYEAKNAGSHDFDMSKDTFEHLQSALAVLKLHVHGSLHNAALLRQAGIPYLIMYRDLRDVAVSHYFYVRRTPWHPEHVQYRQLDIEEGLLHFGRTLLPEFVNWVRSWHQNRDPEESHVVRYEDLLHRTERVFADVAAHFGLDASSETIRPIVEAHSFKNMSGGRQKGQENDSSFFRKGVSGDWRNHFTERVKEVFKEQGDKFWTEYGYEESPDW